MRRFNVMVLAVAVLVASCAANPATGVASNNGLMRVKYESGTGSYVSNDVVGEDAIVNSKGEDTGLSVQHREDRVHTFAWHDWHYYQGREALDEQDYFRLSGDQASSDEIARIRASADTKMKIGMPVALVGLLAGTLAYSGVFGSSQGIKIGVGSAGYAVGLVGALVFYLGKNDMTNRHQLPMTTADHAADIIQDCNEGKCTAMRGGHKRLPPEEAAALRPPPGLPPPNGELPPGPPEPPTRPGPPGRPSRPGRPMPVVGRWHGTSSMTVTVPGIAPKTQSSTLTFEVRADGGQKIVLISDASKSDECPLGGRLDGDRATLTRGVRCVIKDSNTTITMVVRSGTLETTSSGITVHAEFDFTLKPKRGKSLKGDAVMEQTGEPAR